MNRIYTVYGLYMGLACANVLETKTQKRCGMVEGADGRRMGEEREAQRRGGGRGGRRGSKLEGHEEIAVMDEVHEVLTERRRVCNISGCNKETAVKQMDELWRRFPADF